MPDAAWVARGVDKPRRPQASPRCRLGSDQLHRLQTVSDERFAREYGLWRPVVAQVADTFLECGVLDHVTAAISTLTGEHDLAVGIVACRQTHGSRANWQPHRHLLVTDGGFRLTCGRCSVAPVHHRRCARPSGWYREHRPLR